MAEFYTGKKALMEEEDFQEKDVWAATKERETSSCLKLKIAAKDSSSPSPSACRIPALPRVIPRVNHQSSAPLTVPDWSKIYTSKKSDNNSSRDDDAWAANYYGDDEDDEEHSDEMIPPHEFIARRLARSPIVSFSMCEGIGRTLKGRDLSRLRNDILTKTGFLE